MKLVNHMHIQARCVLKNFYGVCGQKGLRTSGLDKGRRVNRTISGKVICTLIKASPGPVALRGLGWEGVWEVMSGFLE